MNPLVSASGKRPLLPLRWALLLVFAVALAVRLYQINTLSLWVDEAYSVWFSDQSWATLWTVVPTFETHPVLYYSLLKVWRTLGSDETTLRLLSAVFNLASMPFVAGTAWLCASKQYRRSAAILSALVFAFSETQIRISQDARPYAMMMLSMSITVFFAVFLMQQSDRATRPIRQLLRHDGKIALAFSGLSAGLALLAWSHNIGLIFDVLIGATLFGWWINQGAKIALLSNLVLTGVLAAILYSPALYNMIEQVNALGTTGFWLTPPSLYQFIKDLVGLALGASAISVVAFPVAVCGLGCLLVCTIWIKDDSPPPSVPILLIVLAFAPMMITALLSYLWQPIFLRRTFEASQIPLIIGLALLPAAIGHFNRPRLARLAGLGIALLAAASAIDYHLTITDPEKRRPENYREIAERAVETAEKMPPTIVALPVPLSLAFIYYARQMNTAMNLIAIPDPYPVIGAQYTYPSGNRGVPGITADMIVTLEKKLSDADVIWFVARSAYIYDPDQLVRHYIERKFPCLVDTLPPYAEKRKRTDADEQCF